ncbi:L-threonine dehydrogenase, partial [Vibrio harveyi]
MTSAFFIPTVNLMGAGCLKDAADSIQSQGFKKGLIVTDKILNQIGVVKQVQDLLT